MWLLAIETTSAHGSIALLEDDAVRGLRALDAGSYSVQLLGAMAELARSSGRELAAVDAFAVATGPGSFTGVRVGLTAVKGLVEVWKRPVAAVSTLAAVAASGMEALGCRRPVVAALDAARGEIYFGLYAPDESDRQSLVAGEEGLESAEQFCRRLAHLRQPLVTPHESVQRAYWEHLGSEAAVVLVPPLLAPCVGRLGRCQLARGGGLDALRLDANYIRRSDAEIFSRR